MLHVKGVVRALVSCDMISFDCIFRFTEKFEVFSIDVCPFFILFTLNTMLLIDFAEIYYGNPLFISIYRSFILEQLIPA